MLIHPNSKCNLQTKLNTHTRYHYYTRLTKHMEVAVSRTTGTHNRKFSEILHSKSLDMEISQVASIMNHHSSKLKADTSVTEYETQIQAYIPSPLLHSSTNN